MVLSALATMKVLHKVRAAPTQVGSIIPSLDLQSKLFIITQTIFGVNRLALFPNLHKFYIYTAFVHSVLAIIITVCINSKNSISVVKHILVVQYIINALNGFIFSKRMCKYFVELAKFDREVGCRPQDSFKINCKFTANMLTILFTVLNFYLSHVLDVVVFSIPFDLLGIYMVQFTEIYFCSHLFDLLLPRLKLVNCYVESAFFCNYPNKKLLKNFVLFGPTLKENNVKMKHIMDLYQIIVSAHNLLVHAVKWQVLLIMTSSFVTLLAFSYRVSLIVIHGTRNVLGALVFMGMLLASVITMLAPCYSNDRVHYQVLRLRELLATRLYNNKLDKWSRSVARALLALTENSDLSFSLMNMFTVDLSLPFTFTSLLVTYLIIMLQFEKVINNNQTETLNFSTYSVNQVE